LVFSEFDDNQIKKEWEKRNNENVKKLQSRKMPVFGNVSDRKQKKTVERLSDIGRPKDIFTAESTNRK
jgi:hypothetical protein